jgi:salicylate hydroxylase
MSWNIYYHPKTPTYFSSQICILGDAAHASGPHQGAGAGQSLEDALILSHVIGTLYRTTPSSTLSSPSPARAKLIEAAFSAYDEVRRPRAQRQVDTAEETGDIFQMNGGQKDMEDVVRDLQGRFGWIWDVDLEKDVQEVDRRFGELVKESGTGAAE